MITGWAHGWARGWALGHTSQCLLKGFDPAILPFTPLLHTLTLQAAKWVRFLLHRNGVDYGEPSQSSAFFTTCAWGGTELEHARL